MIESKTTHPPPVRDDVRGSLSSLLEAHIDCARRLLASAEQLTSHADFDAWREQRHAWRRASALTVNAEFKEEAIHEFLRVTSETSGDGDWERALGDAMRDMRTAIELLTLLHSTLNAGGDPRLAQSRMAAVAESR